MKPAPIFVFGCLFILAATKVGVAIAVPLVIGLAVGVLVGFKAGQYHRGYMHARGIRQSHFNAIRGGH